MKKHIVIRSVLTALTLFIITCGYLLYSSTKVDGELGGRDVGSSLPEVVTTVSGDTTNVVVVPAQPITHPTPVVEEKKSLITRVTQKLEEKKSTFVDQVLSTPSVIHDLPFMSQAPNANWNPPYDEACEEASMIMVHAFKVKQTKDGVTASEVVMSDFSVDEADRLLLENIAWQEQQGYDIDLNAQETVEVLRDYFHLSSRLVYDPTVEDITKALSEGTLVIAPAAGRLLGNPYFTAPGPVYHMIPIIGFDSKQLEFIIHDPGTKRGKNFHYSYEVFMNAIHDWNEGDVLNGKKVIILVD